MRAPPRFPRLGTLKTAEAFRAHAASLACDLPLDDHVLTGAESPLARPVTGITINGKTIGNRWAAQPMEGWDGTPTGGITDDVRRRWRRFGESGAKLVCGGEAMAVRPDGRANPRQLIINEANRRDLAELRRILLAAHAAQYGTTIDLAVGFQLTHSGRFCRPWDLRRPEPRVAYRHPLLDQPFGVTSDTQVFTDDGLEALVDDYVAAARIAAEAGADFVDLKHYHGYLLHELLGAHSRPGPYGGSFENRTRVLRQIIQGIRRAGLPIDLAVRVSAFDLVPFRPDPASTRPGKPGPGIPVDYRGCLPYRFGFGIDPRNPVEPDLTEALAFMRLCAELGVKILNVSGGSPYYNPHIQRPALYPPCDGYQPPEDPLVGVARQVQAVRRLKAEAPPGLLLVGSAYSYLQEFLPQAAQAVLRRGWVDVIGLGRSLLSYPTMLADAVSGRPLDGKRICRTFSACTTAPRQGLISGCYPLDPHYRAKRHLLTTGAADESAPESAPES